MGEEEGEREGQVERYLWASSGEVDEKGGPCVIRGSG